MREVRIFELEHGEPVAAWRVARPSTFKVISGEIWLTVEGDSEDHWLRRGRIDRVAARMRWRGSARARAGARFALASGSERAAPKPLFGLSALSWLPRWLGVA